MGKNIYKKVAENSEDERGCNPSSRAEAVTHISNLNLWPVANACNWFIAGQRALVACVWSWMDDGAMAGSGGGCKLQGEAI